MAYTAVTWTSGDIVTEAKMDAMIANDDHVREEANYYPVVTACVQSQLTAGTISLTDIDITAGGVLVVSNGSGASGVSADVNIGSLPDGVIYDIDLGFSLSGSEGSHRTNATFKFYKSPDIEYLTMWWTLESGTGSGVGNSAALSLNIIGHRVFKGWT